MSRRGRLGGLGFWGNGRRSSSPDGGRVARRSQRAYCRRLGYEILEDRRLLAILTVNTLADGVVPGDGFVTLREAITSANFGLVTDLGEVPDPGFDEIVFAPALNGGTILLFPFLGTLPILSDLEIDASSLPNGLTIDGGDGFDLLPGTADGFSIFNIDDLILGPTIPVSLIGLTLTGGDTLAGVDGGAIYNEEMLTVINCLIVGNVSGGGGGGIFNMDGVLAVTGTTITGNMAAGGMGGGIGSAGGPISAVTATLSTVSNNVAATMGGGIASVAGPVTITNSTVSGNTAIGDGGGLFKAGPPAALTVTSSTFSGNSSDMDGGGMWLMNAPGLPAIISNSTISGNAADDFGGGIYAFTPGAGALTLEHCTVTANTCDADGDFIGAGGGLFIVGVGLPALDHTIVAANLFGPVPAGPFFPSDIGGPALVTAFYSLIGIDTTGTIINLLASSLIGLGIPIAPVLAPLSNNGGPTQTHRLLPGSPAIDAGDPAFAPPPATDQRGAPFVRVFDGDGDLIPEIDIGAYELQNFGFAPVPIIVNTLVDENDGTYGPGDLSLREAIGLANGSIGPPNIITFAPALSAGTVVLSDLLGELLITDMVAIDAGGLPGGLTINAGNGIDNIPGTGDGFRIFNIEFADPAFVGGVGIFRLTMTGGDVTGPGGAIRSVELLTVTDSVITGNATSGLLGFGGGIYGAGLLTAITRSTISGNSTSGGLSGGGGIAAMGTGSLNMLNSTVAGNSTAAATSGGGGILAANTTVITNSTISGNFSAGDGGGLLDGSTIYALSIDSSTISGNTAAVFGGGFATSGGGPATTITRSTITANAAAADGGGISATAFVGGAVVLDHTIVAANTSVGGAMPDINKVPFVGGTISANYSLIGVALPGAVLNLGGTSLIGIPPIPIAPMLGPLGSNGGPTMTHAPLAGSPVIEAGDPAVGGAPQFDQRGLPWTRVYDGNGAGGAVTDIGAVEYHPTAPTYPVLLGDYNLNNVVDAADYVIWRRTLGTAGIPAYSGADGDGDGTIDNDDYDVWRANFGNTFPGAGSGSQAVSADEGSLGSQTVSREVSTRSAASRAVDALSASTPFEATQSPSLSNDNRLPTIVVVAPRTVVLVSSSQFGVSRWPFGERQEREFARPALSTETFANSQSQLRDDALAEWLTSQMSHQQLEKLENLATGCEQCESKTGDTSELGALDAMFALIDMERAF